MNHEQFSKDGIAVTSPTSKLLRHYCLGCFEPTCEDQGVYLT